VLEIVHQRQCRTEGKVLKAPREFHEGLHVPGARFTNQLFQLHRRRLDAKVPNKALSFIRVGTPRWPREFFARYPHRISTPAALVAFDKAFSTRPIC
jgi:hypothetical protein